MLDEAEIILSDSGIIDKDTHTESRYDWNAIVRLAETNDSYYLYTNSYHAIVIPKRVVNAKEAKELTSLLSQNLPLHV